MTTRFARPLVKLAVIVGLAASLGACQTMADLDPTGLLADDATPTPTDNASTPDLANVPGAPPTATPDDQKQVASSLAADGARTQYSADALRAGTEPAAPPPGAAPPVNAQALAAASDAPPSAAAPVATADNAPPSAQVPTAQPVAAPPPPVPVTNAPVAAAAPEAPGANMPAAAPEQMAAIAPTEKATSAPPPGAEPAVPPVPPEGAIRPGLMATPAMSDAALGFAPSSAPPLDPSVRNFVPAPILSHYRRTASLARTSGIGAAGSGAGGPDTSGAAVASLGAPGAVADAVAAMNGGVMPTAIIYFVGDGTGLNAAARAQVRSAVAAFKAGGGEGTVRVVGHASSRTPNMPVEKHLELIFDKSQKRANAVAQELIHEGVPAAKVMIQAVGDSQPVYYESMPKGEDGNRRAEIFVQG